MKKLNERNKSDILIIFMLFLVVVAYAYVSTLEEAYNDLINEYNNLTKEFHNFSQKYAPVVRIIKLAKPIAEKEYSENYNCNNFSKDFYELAKKEGFDVKTTHGHIAPLEEYLETGVGHAYNTICFDYEPMNGNFIEYDHYNFLYYFNESERGSWNGTSLIEMMRGEGG